MTCSCVTQHSPACRSTHAHHIWPLGMGGPDEASNEIVICPNQHSMTHRLIRLWGYRYDGEPPWWVLRHFSPLARELAEQGWKSWDEAGRPVPKDNWVWQGERAAIDSKSIPTLNHIFGHVAG